ncbi:MAG TPA: amidohydrolase family protein [Pseudonocardia sp.]|uniref:amidohydrolase family protein n=1 Tax=Pseudonocardia sp. TaxID=60912 RepID=UPI002C6BEAAB|nr:amidohydrolase family protein [Pseudonocardia sp.]HTF46671.1 amidohydrolase family protein [Pseudonocardia sp.]
MTTTLVTDVGLLVTGAYGELPRREVSLVIEDGVIAGIDIDHPAPDQVIDAAGLTVIPGLVDGHVHPTFGEWTPAQNSIGWVHNYLHGGTTTMVSAGELHVPGLPFDDLTPDLVISLAITAKHTTGRVRPSGVKAHCGTLLLVPGLTEGDFDRLVEHNIHQLKFIFYDWNRLGDGEAQRYVEWAHERGMVVKQHSGGVSRSGSSKVAGYDVVSAVGPDVVAHISGGPIPMPAEEIRQVIDGLPEAAVEVCSSMNYRATMDTTAHLSVTGGLDRLTLGTDTPGGTGVIPRGMLRNICFLSSVCGLDPADAVAAATGNTALLHGLDVGVIAVGRPADLVFLGPVTGSAATDGLESFALGDLPGISMVLVDGEPLVTGRSEQTPPTRRPARITHPGR